MRTKLESHLALSSNQVKQTPEDAYPFILKFELSEPLLGSKGLSVIGPKIFSC